MRFLIKLVKFYSSSTQKHDSFPFCTSKYQILYLSSYCRRPNRSRSKKIPSTQLKNPPEINSFGSLFNEITGILGADELVSDRSSSGISISSETHLLNNEIHKKYPPCTPSVCRNAKVRNSAAGDVSSVVNRIVELVRVENDPVSMEERLSKSGVQFDLDIVEKVLKRCLEVPHLAYRFFNWVKTVEGFCHTTETYNAMVYVAGEAKEFELIKALLVEMERSSCPKDVKTGTILIKQYGKAKLIGKALFVFEKMRDCGIEPDATTYKVMISSLFAAGRADIAMEFYKEMVDKDMVLLKETSYKELLKCMSASGESADYHLVAEDMMNVLQISARDAYGYLLRSFCISRRIKEALELIRDLRNKELAIDVGYYEILVEGLCRADKIGDALEIVDIMKKKKMVDGKVYGFIISRYLRRNEASKALDLFQSMKGEGHLPTAPTYAELMQYLFRINEYREGCKLYDEMLKSGFEPDAEAITAVVAGHVREHHVSEAWKMLKSEVDSRGIEPTWKMCTAFIKELCKAAKDDEIVSNLKAMWASKIPIEDSTIQMVVSFMEKKGDTQGIKKVKRMWRVCKLNPREKVFNDDASRDGELNAELNINHLNSERAAIQPVEPLPKSYDQKDLEEICRILSASMNWVSIQKALEKSTVQFTPKLVEDILTKCSMYGHGHASLQFFSWVREQAGYSHTTETYNAAIKIAGVGKDFGQMENLFSEMKRNGYKITSDTWTIMIMQYGQRGLTDSALRLFNEMKANGCAPSANTYKYLITSLCGRKDRNVDKAIKMFHEMVCAKYNPPKDLLEIYLSCLCEEGKLSDARKCMDTLPEAGFTAALSYSLYVRALCRAGRVEEALALMDEVGSERSTLDQFTYGSLVHGLLRRGRLEEALAQIESMKQAGIHPTVHMYTSLIVHFLKEKQLGRALVMFGKMQREGCEPTVVTYSALICGYVNMGKAADAWKVFHHMKKNGSSPNLKTYSMFITCLCNAGKSEEALELISEMVKSGITPSTVNFRTVIFGLNREGKQDLAQIVAQQKSALISQRRFLE